MSPTILNIAAIDHISPKATKIFAGKLGLAQAFVDKWQKSLV